MGVGRCPVWVVSDPPCDVRTCAWCVGGIRQLPCSLASRSTLLPRPVIEVPCTSNKEPKITNANYPPMPDSGARAKTQGSKRFQLHTRPRKKNRAGKARGPGGLKVSRITYYGFPSTVVGDVK